MRNRNSDVKITTTVMATQPVTTLQVAFYGIDGNDGRLNELTDMIDRWSEDNLGIFEPPHTWATHHVPVRPPV